MPTPEEIAWTNNRIQLQRDIAANRPADMALQELAQQPFTQVARTERLSPSVRQTGQMYAPNGVHVGTVLNQPVNRSAQSVIGAMSPYATVMYAPEAFDPYAFLDRVLGRMYQPNAARQQMIQQALSQPVKMPRFGGGGGGVARPAARSATAPAASSASAAAAPAQPNRVTVDLATGIGKDPDGNPIQFNPLAVNPEDAPIGYNGISDRDYATGAPLGDAMMPPSSAVEPAPVEPIPVEPAFSSYGQFPSRWYPNELMGPEQPVATPNADAVQQQVPVVAVPNTANGKMFVPGSNRGANMEGAFQTPFRPAYKDWLDWMRSFVSTSGSPIDDWLKALPGRIDNWARANSIW